MTEKTPEQPDLQHLKKSAKSGAFWTVANYGVSQGLRFASNLILTHLLFPDLFGLMSLVNVVLMGLSFLCSCFRRWLTSVTPFISFCCESN